MDFRYTEEQQALADTLQRFIAREYGFEHRRELARSPLGFSEAAWRRYAELGLLGLPFPKEFGGLEGNGIDVMIVMEHVGRGLLLEPYLSTVVLCGGLIGEGAPAGMRAAILSGVAAGKLKLALGAYEPQSRYDLRRISSTAARSGSGWRISGRKCVVLDAPSADFFLVSAHTCPAAREPAQDLALFLVPREADGVSLLPYPTQSGGRAADLALADVYVEESALIAPAGSAHEYPRARCGSSRRRALCRGGGHRRYAQSGDASTSEDTPSIRSSDRHISSATTSHGGNVHRRGTDALHGHRRRPQGRFRRCRRTARGRRIQGLHRRGRAIRRTAGIQLHGAMGMVDDFVVSHYFKRLTMIDMTFGDADFQLARFSDSMTAA